VHAPATAAAWKRPGTPGRVLDAGSGGGLATFMTSLGNTVVKVALPSIQHDLQPVSER
jgi:hypothetical protein